MASALQTCRPSTDSRSCHTFRTQVGSRPSTSSAVRNNRLKGGFVGPIETPQDNHVDVIAIPCPGADPWATWHGKYESPRPSHLEESWVTSTLKRTVPYARILTYAHRGLREGLKLEDFAADLLDAIHDQRERERVILGTRIRPIFFVCHNIGGLVVKVAINLAAKIDPEPSKHRPVYLNTYAIAGFGVPHRGSKFLSTNKLAGRIKELLHLEHALPHSLRRQLEMSTPRKPNEYLEGLNQGFRLLIGEMWIWSFTETRETSFTVLDRDDENTVTFWEPVTSYQSSIIGGYRHEMIRPLAKTHVDDIAYFADNKDLVQLHVAWLHYFLEKAWWMTKDENSYAPEVKASKVTNVKKDILVEVRGVFHGQEEAQSAVQQYWTARSYFPQFMSSGPVKCLEERLNHITTSTSSQSENINYPSPKRDDEKPTCPSQLDVSLNLEDSQQQQQPPQSSPSSVEPQTWQTDEDHYDVLNEEDDSEIGELEVRPNMQALNYVWVHLPWNNPVWVADVLQGVGWDNIDLDIPAITNEQNWGRFITHGKLNSHHSKFVEPSVGLIQMNRHSTQNMEMPPVCMYLNMPYLHFDTYKNIIRRSHTISARWNRGRTSPVPNQIANDKSLERRVIYKYLGYNPAFNIRRTLDEYGYPEISCNARNGDQVLYKRSKDKLLTGHLPAKMHDHGKQSAGGAPQRRGTMQSVQEAESGTSSPTARLSHVWNKVLHTLGVRGQSELQLLPVLRAETALEEVSAMKDRQELDVTGLEESAHALDGHLIMVDQLWLKLCQARTLEEYDESNTNPTKPPRHDILVTFFPEREDVKSERPQYSRYADLRDGINAHLQSDHFEDAWDLAAACVYDAVTVMLESTTEVNLHVWRAFEEDISIQSEQLTTSLKIFKEEGLTDPNARGDFDSTPARILGRHRIEREKEERKYKDNLSALVELRDIYDELSVLDRLFTQQTGVVEKMRDLYEDGIRKRKIPKNPHRASLELIGRTLEKLDEYKGRAKDMQDRVNMTRDAFEKHLQMIQSQAQVIEVRNSRLQADLAGSQGRSLLVLAVVTIFFSPLSFFTSFFGMNTATAIDQLSLNQILAITIPLSATLIFLAMFFAFNEHASRGIQTFQHRTGTFLADLTKLREEAGKKMSKEMTYSNKTTKMLEQEEGLTFKGNAYLGNRTRRPNRIPYENLTAEGRKVRKKLDEMLRREEEEMKKRLRHEGR